MVPETNVVEHHYIGNVNINFVIFFLQYDFDAGVLRKLKTNCKTLILRKKVNFVRHQQQNLITWGCNRGQLSRVYWNSSALRSKCKRRLQDTGSYSIYPWVARSGPATQFPTLFKTEF